MKEQLMSWATERRPVFISHALHGYSSPQTIELLNGKFSQILDYLPKLAPDGMSAPFKRFEDGAVALITGYEADALRAQFGPAVRLSAVGDAPRLTGAVTELKNISPKL